MHVYCALWIQTWVRMSLMFAPTYLNWYRISCIKSAIFGLSADSNCFSLDESYRDVTHHLCRPWIFGEFAVRIFNFWVEGERLNLDTNWNHLTNLMVKWWDIVYSTWNKTVTTGACGCLLHSCCIQFFIYGDGCDGWEKLLIQELRGYEFKIKLVRGPGNLLYYCRCTAESHDDFRSEWCSGCFLRL